MACHGCFIEPCSNPGDPAHGWARDRDFRHGRSVRFQCFRGYQIVGASSITCDDGSWDNRAPVCKGKDTFNYPSDILIVCDAKLYNNSWIVGFN